MNSPPSTRRTITLVLLCLTSGMAASCASEPLKLYTLDPGASEQRSASLSLNPIVVEIPRVSIPDYLNSQDILIRTGNNLTRSSTGRLASRLPVEITDFLTVRLAGSHRDALVTDQPQAETPTYRLIVNVSLFDIKSDGAGIIEANWSILPSDKSLPIKQFRTREQVAGPVLTDQDVVTLQQDLLEQLTNKIGLSLFS